MQREKGRHQSAIDNGYDEERYVDRKRDQGQQTAIDMQRATRKQEAQPQLDQPPEYDRALKSVMSTERRPSPRRSVLLCPGTNIEAARHLQKSVRLARYDFPCTIVRQSAVGRPAHAQIFRCPNQASEEALGEHQIPRSDDHLTQDPRDGRQYRAKSVTTSSSPA